MLRVAEEFSQTDTGRARRANEDSLFARSPVFVVADGMGGAQAGEVASRIAVDAFEPGLPDTGSPEEKLASIAREANGRIYQLARVDQQRAGMGTTLTAAFVGDGEVSLAHVGDSRAYLWRDGQLRRLTRDHTLVDELLRRGKLTEEEAEHHPQRSIITRALGPESEVEVDTGTHPARDGDVFLLCSDGLTAMIGEKEMAAVLNDTGSLEETGGALIARANDAGGRDNITVVLFRLADDAGGPPDASVDQATMVGAGAPTTQDVQAALAEQPAQGGASTATEARPAPTGGGPPVRTAPTPRRPRPAPAKPERRRRRFPTGFVVALAILALVGTAGWIASRGVFFVGTDNTGSVTIFRGLPYDLPAGIRLYQQFYVSGVSATEVAPNRRGRLLDHRLRSRGDAADLVDQLEAGRLDG